MARFLRGQWVYLAHVIALVRPGGAVPSFEAHRVTAQDLTDWDDADLLLMIDEGRRQSDRQLAALTEVRSRAQWLFTVGAPIVAAVGAVFAAFDGGDSTVWVFLWLVSLLSVGYGALGGAAIMTIRADFKSSTARCSVATHRRF